MIPIKCIEIGKLEEQLVYEKEKLVDAAKEGTISDTLIIDSFAELNIAIHVYSVAALVEKNDARYS